MGVGLFVCLHNRLCFENLASLSACFCDWSILESALPSFDLKNDEMVAFVFDYSEFQGFVSLVFFDFFKSCFWVLFTGGL